jgi:hypothetical protein
MAAHSKSNSAPLSPTQSNSPYFAATPAVSKEIAPRSQSRNTARPPLRRPFGRFYSDYGALHPSIKRRSGWGSFEGSLRRSSLHSSGSSAVSPGQTSDGGRRTDRRSSTVSASVVAGGHTIVVRTNQSPLRPPEHKSPLPVEKSGRSSIKVESEFPEVARPIVERRGSTPTSSTRIKQVLSAPLRILRRFSLSGRKYRSNAATPPTPAPSRRRRRMADHTTQLRRNYTAEALYRVTVALQELKQASATSLFAPQIVRPSTWKSRSEKVTKPRIKPGPKTTQGIISGLSYRSCTENGCQASGTSHPHSYTSSVRDIRMGVVPTTTPDETATYKVKRSPSAETEEFLKVDISIRGGTSYLPSEARRIHTPPLPEERIDGRWKGFFFDYNAPESESSHQPTGQAIPVRSRGNTVQAPGSPTSMVSLDSDRTKFSSERCEPSLGRTKSKNKRIVTGDWVDIKLAEIELLGNVVDQASIKSSNRRINTPHMRSNDHIRIVYDCQVVTPEIFDVSIPEHLPSSPLCPRHPRYWRVVSGRGSQFRGCWMHGIGLNEDIKL